MKRRRSAMRRGDKAIYYWAAIILLLILSVLGYWYMNLPIPEEIPSRSLKI